MKKQFRAFLALFALMVCLSCGLAAPAQAVGLPHAEAIQDSFGYPDSTRYLIDNIWIALTNYGGPYYCVPAPQRSAAQTPGDAPEEDAVALLHLYVQADLNDTLLNLNGFQVNISGHAFLVVENVSDTEQTVGGLPLAPGTTISFGTYGNTEEHTGIWYGLEGFLDTNNNYKYSDCIGLQTSLRAEQLAVLNQNLARADHWSAVYNCASFAQELWNSVCADTLDAAFPYSPATLKADLLTRYPDLYSACLPLRCDYAVLYSPALIPSEEFC